MQKPDMPTVGWSDVFKNILDTCHVVLDCNGTLNTKCHFDLLLFHLAQGLRVTETILPVTLKSANQVFTSHF